MAIVTKYGTGYRNPNALLSTDGIYAEGRVRVIFSKAVLANGDSATSKIFLGKIPSSAIMLKQFSRVSTEAITGLTDVDIGLYLNGVAAGTGGAEIIANGQTFATAADVALLAGVTTPNLGLRVWELLGLTQDPGVEYDVVALLNAGAGAAGSFTVQLWYLKT
jgi:hypothetical protein